MLPIITLNLYPEYSLHSFKRDFGKLPPFDPTLSIKYWTASEEYKTPYFYFDKKSKTIKQYSGECPIGYNIPQEIKYPSYVIEPTLARMNDSTNSMLNEEFLSKLEQANKIRKEIGLKEEISESTFGKYNIFWNGETRRIWNIGALNVGLLLKRKNSAGVGRIGHWEFDKLSDEKQPLWIPDVINQNAFNKDLVPVPCRELKSNEYIHTSPFGSYVAIKDEKIIDDDISIHEKLDRILEIVENL